MKQIACDRYNIDVGANWHQWLAFLEERRYTRHFVLVDENTRLHCLPIFLDHLPLDWTVIETKPGEQHKNLDTCKHIWTELVRGRADRRSVLVNLGGGVIGDMGGFAASCYMRGIDFIQVPTTLLAQVDASVGAKLGVDFQNYKNMIGLFNEPQAVWIDPIFLRTLDDRQLRSGFAEILKHAIIADSDFWKALSAHESLDQSVPWATWIHRSVHIKHVVVQADPREAAMRKILNFGHTVGHALESISMRSDRPLLHGEAIAIGMVCEAFIAHRWHGLSKQGLDEIEALIRCHFKVDEPTVDAAQIIEVAALDKKNVGDTYFFSLPSRIGTCDHNISIPKPAIDAAWSYYTTGGGRAQRR